MRKKIYLFLIILSVILLVTNIKQKNEISVKGESIITYAKELGFNESNLTGNNVCVAVLDTGISSHPDVIDSLIYFKDFTDSNANKPYDDNGHGTAVAGIILGNGSLSKKAYRGLAPNANIISLKIFDSNGRTTIACIEKGIDWLSENIEKYDIDIICMPIGYDISGYNKDPLYDKIKILNEKVIVVAAAGNYNTIRGPGGIEGVISVGSIDNNSIINNEYNVATFSPSFLSRKLTAKPEIFAPGVDIIVPSNDVTEKYRVMSGTSLSAGYIAGYIAILAEKYPDLENKELYEFVLNKTDEKGIVNFNCN